MPWKSFLIAKFSVLVSKKQINQSVTADISNSQKSSFYSKSNRFNLFDTFSRLILYHKRRKFEGQILHFETLLRYSMSVCQEKVVNSKLRPAIDLTETLPYHGADVISESSRPPYEMITHWWYTHKCHTRWQHTTWQEWRHQLHHWRDL